MISRLAAGLAALALTAGVTVATAPPAHADPCFFGASEFSDWYDGARWGASLSTVEDQYANCTGVWTTGIVYRDWNGHTVKERVWPRPDGGQTTMRFAVYSTGDRFRSHDEATTGNLNVGGNEWRKECEWPRPEGNPC